mgnify:FL=1
MIHPQLEAVTEQIQQRSLTRRAAYLEKIRQAAERPRQQGLSCSNLAHVMAAESEQERLIMRSGGASHIAIISSYNDMLSAHVPLADYPEILKKTLLQRGATAQFAAGVPAMCDGVTQGTAAMQLSLFSRDLIAQATAIGLSHGVFDGALYLGVCDKIVPGLLIGALHFGHLPAVFVPAGPMHSGLSNPEKAAIRERYARGEVSRDELLTAELAAYHEAGTCTFYGTANTNQMLMEAMGLHVPGSAFVHPQTLLRTKLTEQAALTLLELTKQGERYLPVGLQINAKALVNGMVALLATSGSTNHGLHLPAIARAAGYELRWEDFAQLAQVVPQLAKVYPNGAADVNQFHAAGGVAWVLRELLGEGLLHADVQTAAAQGISAYTQEAYLHKEQLAWRDLPDTSPAENIVRVFTEPCAQHGGWHLLQGNLGRAMVKSSAVKPEFWSIRAPAKVFASEQAAAEAYQAGTLTGDFVMVVRFQGPRANGMPELHSLMPLLANLQQRGQQVALVTDGRLSGASGKVLTALHVTPEAASAGSVLSLIQNDDLIHLDVEANVLQLEVTAEVLASRQPAAQPKDEPFGYGLELFKAQRQLASPADQGASFLTEE